MYMFFFPNLGVRLFNCEKCFEILNRLRTELTRFSGYDISDSLKLPEIDLNFSKSQNKMVDLKGLNGIIDLYPIQNVKPIYMYM